MIASLPPLADLRMNGNLVAGGALALAGLALGLVLMALAGSALRAIVAVFGDRLNERAIAAARRTLRRAGWVVTALLVAGAAAAAGYFIWTGRDLAAELRIAATPERLRAGAIVGAEVLAILIGAVLATVIAGRLVRWLEQGLVATGFAQKAAGVKEALASIVALVRLLIFAYAIVLSIGVAGAPAPWVERANLALTLLAILLGAVLGARVAGLLLQGLASFLAEAPEKGALRYFVRLRGLLAIGKRAAELLIYVYSARLVVAAIDVLRPLGIFGDRLITTILYLLVARVVVEVVSLVIHDLFLERPADASEETAGALATAEGRARTFVPIVRSLASYFIYFFVAMEVLAVWGIETKTILASAGILGLAFGLGAQKLTADLVAGFFILFEGVYFVGHYIAIGDKEGIVESITIRTTLLRDAKGVLHVIPNGSVNVVSNYSTGFVDAVLDVALAYDVDFPRVKAVIEGVGRSLDEAEDDVLAPTVVEGIVELTAADAVVRTRTRVRPGRHEWAKCELRRRVKEALDAEKIPLKAMKG